MTPRLKLLVLRCADLAKSRDFYTCIGLDLKPEQHGTGPRHYACEMDGFVLEIYPARSAGGNDADGMLGFEVVSLEAVLRRLAATGVLPKQPPVMLPQGLRVLVPDPDGRTVELIQPN